MEAKTEAAHKKRAKKQAREFAPLIPAGVRVKSFLETDGVIAPPTFDAFSMLQPDDFIILNGTRREGKSWMARYFLYALRNKFRCGEVFTTTKQNKYWQAYFPEVRMHDAVYSR